MYNGVMTNFSAVLCTANGDLFAVASFYDYDDAVAYIVDWTDIGIASVVDFHTGELLFTLVPDESDSPS